MSELKDRWFWAYPTESVDCDGITGSANEVYSKSEVDEVLAKKDKEILRLTEDWNRLCEKYNKFIKLKQEFCDKFKDIELEITK